MRIKKIETKNLQASDVPALGNTWVQQTPEGEDARLVEFALSFDGYEFFGRSDPDDISLGDFCNTVAEAHTSHPHLLKIFNTTGLRMLLFFQQRKERDELEISDYAKVLIEAIRARLSNA